MSTVIDIDKCISTAQKAALKRDISQYIENELREQSEDLVEKLAKNWLKDNADYIQNEVEECMPKLVEKLVKRITLEITRW